MEEVEEDFGGLWVGDCFWQIPQTIVIKFVVRSQGWKGPGTNAVSKEDLSGCIDPCLAVFEILPVHLEKIRRRRVVACLWELKRTELQRDSLATVF